jgi:hypothetical protein
MPMTELLKTRLEMHMQIGGLPRHLSRQGNWGPQQRMSVSI